MKELVQALNEIQRFQEKIAVALQSVSLREGSLAGMLRGVQNELKEQGTEVVLAENDTDTVLRIPEHQLQFALGKHEIPPAHVSSANIIGRALLNALSKPENRALLDTVFLGGHTDSVPNSRELGYWGLSTYRAISLWNFWTKKPGEGGAKIEVRSREQLRLVALSAPRDDTARASCENTTRSEFRYNSISVSGNRTVNLLCLSADTT